MERVIRVPQNEKGEGKTVEQKRGAAPVFHGGRRDFSRDSSALATMDGESGDSSSELHIASVPNPNDSECHRKSGDNIMCVPPDVTTPTHPTDFSLKFNNNIPRFSWNDPRTIIDNKKIDMLQQRDHGDIIKNINTESDNYNNVYGGNNRENNQRIADFIIANKEYRNNFNIGQPSSDSAIGYVNKEQTRMRATDFAVALNYNKDLHRTSDFAGMILQHHQRFVPSYLLFIMLIKKKKNFFTSRTRVNITKL